MFKNIINRVVDSFDKQEFSVKPQKKLKTISKDFEEAFGLELVFYKGKKIAEGDLTLSGLNRKTAEEVDTKAEDLQIKASMTVGEAEAVFKDAFGTTIQIKSNGVLVDNALSLGDARRQAEAES